jgi:hypothetical protein
LKIYKVAKNIWDIILHDKSNVLIQTKNGLGEILSDFFTNSSGHPDREQD